MRLANLFRSSTFRLPVIYACLFAISVAALLGLVYWHTIGVIGRQTDATIEAEILGLAEQYKRRGLIGLVETVRSRSERHPERRSIYLLTDPLLHPLAGNLSAWPKAGQGNQGWINFLVEKAEDPQARARVARARVFILPQAYRLLVGRDTTERAAFQRLMLEALAGALGLTLVLGILGGVLMSRSVLRRIDSINRGSQAILRGDLTQRMPVSGTGDEFDRLAENLNAMLDQIERLMKGIREVTDDIAHDLRSPISRLRTRLEMALMERADIEAYRNALRDAIGEADSILATFKALLDIALAESGAPREGFQELNLTALVGDIAELYAPLAEEQGLSMTAELEDGLTVSGNRHLLSQALGNLIENAITYTPRGSALRLTASRDAKGIVVAVSDNGPGIPAQDREKVLQRFIRLEASRTKPGSGLGLSLVAAVARLHGAVLRLEDNEPGLRASIRFPARHAPEARNR